MPEPTLTPVPPTPGRPVTLGTRSPAWIGGHADSVIQISLPGVADRHVALVEREDGWWASEGRGQARLSGAALRGTVRLKDGDTIEVAPGYRYQFLSGAVHTDDERPVVAAPRRKRKRRRTARPPGVGRPWAVIGVVALIVVLGLGAIFGIWRASRSEIASAPLTDAQAEEFDSLLVVAYDHVERGSTLLEMGLPDVAAQEFARGVNTLALSDLRSQPQVRPRTEALEASVAAIYRERRLTVPRAYASARTSLSPEKLRAASLSIEQFAVAFAQVESAYQSRFREPIFVSGRDHAEHLSLYGAGGALDLRTKTMTPSEVRFVINECKSRAIRVKDFSQDSILQRQVAAALAAGLLDRAGTGLHLHIDRFANKRDHWTVSNSHQQEFEPGHVSHRELGAIVQAVLLTAFEGSVVNYRTVEA
jgi:hypothetical protein